MYVVEIWDERGGEFNQDLMLRASIGLYRREGFYFTDS